MRRPKVMEIQIKIRSECLDGKIRHWFRLRDRMAEPSRERERTWERKRENEKYWEIGKGREHVELPLAVGFPYKGVLSSSLRQMTRRMPIGCLMRRVDGVEIIFYYHVWDDLKSVGIKSMMLHTINKWHDVIGRPCVVHDINWQKVKGSEGLDPSWSQY
jgi:hypothetical protein